MLWAYKSVILLEPPSCLGRRLKPFTCGHAAILYAYESPFATSGVATLEELVFAVWVCSQEDYEATIAKLRGRRFIAESRRWAARAKVTAWRAEVDVFKKYITDHMTAKPQRWDDDEPSQMARAPWPWLVTAALIKSGMPGRESWNVPVNAAFCRMASFAALAGSKDFMAEREVEIGKKLSEAEHVES